MPHRPSAVRDDRNCSRTEACDSEAEARTSDGRTATAIACPIGFEDTKIAVRPSLDAGRCGITRSDGIGRFHRQWSGPIGATDIANTSSPGGQSAVLRICSRKERKERLIHWWLISLDYLGCISITRVSSCKSEFPVPINPVNRRPEARAGHSTAGTCYKQTSKSQSIIGLSRVRSTTSPLSMPTHQLSGSKSSKI